MKISRRRLRASSSRMYQVVNSTKLYIPSVEIGLWGGEVKAKLKFDQLEKEYTLKFKKNQTGGTQICQDFREDVFVENSDYMVEGIDWFRQMCLQKNVTIGRLEIEAIFNPQKVEKTLDLVLRKSETPLKIKSIFCVGMTTADIMWKIMHYSDKKVLKEMKVKHRKARSLVSSEIPMVFDLCRNLKKIEMECTCIVSDEDLLALNASVIVLKFENFSEDLIYKLIEKFTNRREEGSAFWIVDSKWAHRKQKLSFKAIPPGLEKVFCQNGYENYQLIDTNEPTVYLRLSDCEVILEIGDTSKADFWIDDPDYDDRAFDESDSEDDEDEF
ncbi:hypothetical protein GCK72_002778 [Caenorhabditis remanei]|uniref:DUF38 domain-containing protein n=1 Tax=Caenorhabditis remanei TaxID=31234 RepID=A0A6A5HW13_CAERE|nr:hypothetical protein GCK72_002778 [Caenorhabditis remanei]KAF1770954.1 hypothetical protein GCK72_002778 [Caenorhabditis remanei]